MRALLLAAAAFAVLALAPASALATHDVTVNEATPTQSRCEAKGFGGFGAPANPAAGTTLAPGAYLYFVQAITADTPRTCAPIVVGVDPTQGQTSALLQWAPTPGAGAYEIFRAPVNPANGQVLAPPQALVVSPGNTLIPASASCAGAAASKRCLFQDNGGPTTATPSVAQAPTAATETQAGSHADLRIRETVDYGGQPNTPITETRVVDGTGTLLEPFGPVGANGAQPQAIRTNLLHFPPGLIANPRAAATCNMFGPSSIFGSPTLYGSQDSQEDTCPANTRVGTVQTITRVPNPSGPNPTRLSISFGDIYNVRTRNGEAGRLAVVVRPVCSAGNPVAPGSATCNAVFQGAYQAQGVPAAQAAALAANTEAEKEVLGAVATIDPRGGDYAVNVNTVQIEAHENGTTTDELLAQYNQLLTPANLAGGDTTFVRAAQFRVPKQVREIKQDLAAYADQGSAARADDVPFVTLPTSCGPKSLSADVTTHADTAVDTGAASFLTDNCQNVPFEPGLVSEVLNDQSEAPGGLATTVAVCPDTRVDGCSAAGDDPIHQSHIRTITARFPEGVVVSAAAGNVIPALGTEIGDISGFADELGELRGPITLKRVDAVNKTFTIEAEIKPRRVDGEADPLTKIAIEALVIPNQTTGQLEAHFDNLPQVPFKWLELEFTQNNSATNSALVNPPTNGTHIVRLELDPWSGQPQVEVDDSFTTQGAISPRAFTPTLSTSLNTTQAAATSQLKLRIEKPDRQQNLEGFDLELPSGLVTKLSDFQMCPAAGAQSGNCGDASQMGTVTIVAGNGTNPLALPGKVFLAEPIPGTGDLASLVVVVPAAVGPFNLGTVVTRSRIKLDATRIGVATTTVDPLPTILDGIPVRIRSIELTLNSMRNPQSCDPAQFKATLRSQSDPTTAATRAEGGLTAQAVAPFQATGCENLPFAPKLGVVAQNEANSHPAVSTVITQSDTEASQSSAKVTLPAGLSANPAVLQNLCSPAQLAGGGCAANTRVGTATANSPLLPTSLTGPVYVVSRPGETLPKLVVQLRGILNLDLEGVVSLADGGRLATTFTGLPNTPVTSFRLDLIGGNATSGTPLFTARNELCNGNQRALGEFAAYNGKTASDNPLVAVTGTCPPPIAAAGTPSRNSGRATVTMKIKRVRRGRPVLDMTVRRSRTSANIKRVTLSLPSGLRFRSRPTAAALRGISVRTANGRQVPRSAIRIEKGRLVITRNAGSSVFRVTLRRGIVETGRTFRRMALRRLKQRRLTFRVQITDVQNERYTITKRIRPQS